MASASHLRILPSAAQAQRRPLVFAAGACAAAFVAVSAGIVQLPDFEAGLQSLSERLGAWTYALVAVLAFLETGAFVGLLAPGETAVVLGGVVAAQGEIDLVAILLLTWCAAALGDFASFALGRRLGRPFLVRRGSRLGITPQRLERVDRFFDRHGPKAILAGRFVGIVRAMAPFLAGASRMRLRAFVPWSVLGTGVWSAAFVLAGYAFSESFDEVADTLTHAALGLAVLLTGVLLWRTRRAASDEPPASPTH